MQKFTRNCMSIQEIYRFNLAQRVDQNDQSSISTFYESISQWGQNRPTLTQIPHAWDPKNSTTNLSDIV